MSEFNKLSIDFQRKIYETYKANHDATVKNGWYEYTIAYNACCTIHTWIIWRRQNREWHWCIPLDESIR